MGDTAQQPQPTAPKDSSKRFGLKTKKSKMVLLIVCIVIAVGALVGTFVYTRFLSPSVQAKKELSKTDKLIKSNSGSGSDYKAQADALAKSAKEVSSNTQKEQLYRTQADLLFLKGDYLGSYEAYKQAEGIFKSTDIQIITRIGWLAQRNQDTANEIVYYKKALSLYEASQDKSVLTSFAVELMKSSLSSLGAQ